MNNSLLQYFVIINISILALTSCAEINIENENYDSYYIGYKKIEIESNATGEEFPIAFVYPTKEPSELVEFGPFEMELSIGSEVAQGEFPLVIISHGSGGTSLGHRSIAFALVKQGFIVAMPQHPENNYQNNSAAGTVKNWNNRPKHISSVIDALLSNPELSRHIDAEKVAVIGHSAGGYTALAVAGGKANTGHIIELCETNPMLNEPFCGLVKENKMKSVEIQNPRDERVKAIVLMAPVGILFQSKDSLAQVEIPTLLLRAEKDNELTEPYHSEIIARNYKDKSMLTYRTVENAGHYSFITPFPEAIISELGAVAKDPVGFNREEFHNRLSSEIVSYLKAVLK
ncbi:alpha/beta hydrolase family protein [Vreelandella titanicae]|uniref:alpha/beta hydrolase family protein n=1 Tax=Vreelandella titanicae TaxID=664683 RepID=UPI00381CF3C5